MKDNKEEFTGGYNDYRLSDLRDVSAAPEYVKTAARVVGQLVTITPRGARVDTQGEICPKNCPKNRPKNRPLIIPAVKLRNRVFLGGYPLWQCTAADIAPFFDEYTIRASTATLIEQDQIVAARHAVADIDVISGNTFFIPERWKRHPAVAGPRCGAHIRVPRDRYFRVESIIDSSRGSSKYDDWVILKLEREVDDDNGRRLPIPMATDDDRKNFAGADLFTLTHPLGLPLKYSQAEDVSSGGDHDRVLSDFGSGSSGAPLLLHEGGRTRLLGIVIGDTRFTIDNVVRSASGPTIDPLAGADDSPKPQPVTIASNIGRHP